MSEQRIPAVPPVPWPLRPFGRILVSALVAGTCLLSTAALPLETRIVLGLDVFLLTFVTLVYVLMSVATPEQCAVLALKGRPLEKNAVLFATILTSLVSVAAIGMMLNSQRDHARWLRLVHLAASLGALLLGWIAAQMIFGIQYMRIYYSNLLNGGGSRSQPDLHFPGQSAPVLWDFMYYSFTVAMCYGTTDVAIYGTQVRRLTLLHAIFSFLFVAAIIGFVVSVLSSLA